MKLDGFELILAKVFKMPEWFYAHDLECLKGLALSPGALSQDFVQVQSHGLLVDQVFYLGFQFVREDPHQSLRSKPVLGTLLVVTLRHVLEKVVSGQVDIVNDFAQVLFEVGIGQVLQVIQSVLGNVTLQLQFALAFLADGPQAGMFHHPVDKLLGQLEALGGGGDLAAGEGESLLVLLGDAVLGHLALVSQVGSEADQVEVLLDVVHNLGLEESLSGIIHDLIAQLGFGNVLAQLLNTGALGGRAVLVDDLVALPLGTIAVGESGNELFDDLEFTPEKRVFFLLNFVFVHAQDFEVDTGNGLDEALVGSGQLEFSEQAGGDAASGRAGKTDLAIDNNRAIDIGANQSATKGIKISLKRGSGVANGDAIVGETRVLFLQSLNDVMKADNLFDLHFASFFGDIDDFDFATVVFCASLQDLDEFHLVGLAASPSDSSEFSVFADFVGGPSADGVAIDVDNGLLPHVHPNDRSILGPLVATSFFDGLFKTILGGLTTAEDFVSGHPPEVGDSIEFVGQLLDLFKVVQHGRSLVDLGVGLYFFRHLEVLYENR